VREASNETITPALIKDSVVAVTVRLLNDRGVGAVTTEAICGAAGVSAAEFRTVFPSEHAVFAEIIDRLMAEHGSRRVHQITRRRSLTDLLYDATMSFLEVLEQLPAEHQALMCLRVAEINNPGLVMHRGPERTIDELLTTNSRLWLDEIEKIQGITWTLPTTDLATIQVGATYALVLDYLSRRDRTAAEQTIRISAYHLGTYGRRQFKNAKQ
jgi:AcrR family transcriptional regulator